MTIIVGFIALVANATWAHQGVQNAAVMARMNGMTSIADAMKVIGDMVKGTTAFDRDIAREALSDVAAASAQTLDLFAAPEDDPKSEARPEIWSNFSDFGAKSDALTDLAEALAVAVDTPADLRSAL
ncbi:MAG: cytochrome c, partial [Rhodobacteraceae bacterium]|nr:cytochrome c [Paracoccaceae bacterium]